MWINAKPGDPPKRGLWNGSPSRQRRFEENIPGIGVGRDGCRTPMQWDAKPNAGFSTAVPLLTVAEDFMHENVHNLEADRTSLLSLYKALIALRRRTPALATGAYESVASENDLLFYRRRGVDSSLVVALNFGADPVSLQSPLARGQILVSTLLDRTGKTISGSLDLRGNEGVIAIDLANS